MNTLDSPGYTPILTEKPEDRPKPPGIHYPSIESRLAKTEEISATLLDQAATLLDRKLGHGASKKNPHLLSNVLTTCRTVYSTL